MTDFYGRLEEQLMTAAGRRVRQGAVGRAVAGRRPQLAGALALAAVVAAVVAFVPGALRSSATPAGPVSAPEAPSLKGIRVAVFNATTQSGRAREVAGLLARRGAVISELANHADQRGGPADVVRFVPGAEAQARRVAQTLHVAGVSAASGNERAFGDARVFVVVRTLRP